MATNWKRARGVRNANAERRRQARYAAVSGQFDCGHGVVAPVVQRGGCLVGAVLGGLALLGLRKKRGRVF